MRPFYLAWLSLSKRMIIMLNLLIRVKYDSQANAITSPHSQ